MGYFFIYQSLIIGGGRLNLTNSLVYYIYHDAFAQFNFGYVASITLLLAVTLVVVYLQLQTAKEE